MADVIITGDDDSVSSEWCPEVSLYENADSYDGIVLGNPVNKEGHEKQPRKDGSKGVQQSENCVSLLLSLRNTDRPEPLCSTPSQSGSESVESSSSGDSSGSVETPQGPLSVLLQMVLKSAQEEAEQTDSVSAKTFSECADKDIIISCNTPRSEQDISESSQQSRNKPVHMYPQRSPEELKSCGIIDPAAANDSEVIISRDFFLFLLGHADGERIAPFLNNSHYRFQFVDDNWFRISPELFNMEVSTIIDQHIRASPHQLHLIKMLLFQRAIRHSMLAESTKRSKPSTEQSPVIERQSPSLLSVDEDLASLPSIDMEVASVPPVELESAPVSSTQEDLVQGPSGEEGSLLPPSTKVKTVPILSIDLKSMSMSPIDLKSVPKLSVNVKSVPVPSVDPQSVLTSSIDGKTPSVLSNKPKFIPLPPRDPNPKPTQSPRYLRKTCSHLTLAPKQSSHVWTKEEDTLLEAAVKQYGYKHWKEIAQEVGTRNAVQCRQRYFTLHRSHRVGRWSDEENRILLDCVKKNMEISEIMKYIPRSVKQIKDRLEIMSCSHAQWTERDINCLFELVEQFGFRWSMFTSYFPNRTAGRIKDKYWSERRKRERKESS